MRRTTSNMPRRPSASATLVNSSSSTMRAHKSNGSHSQVHLTQPAVPQTVVLSSTSLGASATPQQKILQVLVNRLKNKLPCHSGVALDMLEADKATQQAVEAVIELSHDSLDIIALALSELLERLARNDVNGVFSLEVLQSQLFVLKVFSAAMASRWNRYQEDRSSSRAGKSPTESPIPPGGSVRSRHTSSEHSTAPTQSTNPPALDDNCARYILSVMVLFLRQTLPPETGSTWKTHFAVDDSFHDFERLDVSAMPATLSASRAEPSLLFQIPEPMSPNPLRSPTSSTSLSSDSARPALIPPCGLEYERSHSLQVKSAIALNNVIAKFAGRIIYHLSASNWPVVFHRLRTKIHFLAQTTDEQPDTIDLHLMAYSALDRTRLIQVLNELGSLLVNMKRDVQVAISIPLRTALWNWIEIFPSEFNDAIRSRGRMEGAPERVFDLLYSSQAGNEKILWPTLTVLNCISSERISSDFQVNHFGSAAGNIGGQKSYRKDNRFIEDLIRHANTSSKLAEVALVCILDMCKAAAHVRPEGEVALRIVAYDLAHEVKSVLWKNWVQKPFWESGEEIDVELYAQAMVTVFRFLPEEESVQLLTICVEPERSEAVKICVVKACVILILEAPRLPVRKSFEKLEVALARRLRSIYKASTLRRHELDQYSIVKKAASRPKVKPVTTETLPDREVLLLGLLSLWRVSSTFFMTTMAGAEIDEWFSVLLKLWEAPVDNTVKISAACSFRLSVETVFRMPTTHPMYEGLVSWMKRSLSETLISVVTNLIHSRGEAKDQQLWIQTAHKIIELFCRTSHAAKDIQLATNRIPAFAMAEIAFLITLTSADNDVTKLSAHSLRLIANAERQPGAPENPRSGEELSKRYLVYEQLGDPNVTIIGRVGYQKRIRKLVRMIATPSPSHIAVWEECYWRWRALSEFVLQAHPVLDDSEKNQVTMTWEEKHIQWRNLTLFLAAFGGACVEEGQSPGSLSAIIPSQYLPDEMRVLQNPGALVDTFVTDLTDLLVVDSMQVREVAREALGSELSPRLYSRLLKHLEDVIRRITQGAGTELTDTFALFLDQFIAVLKLLVENAQVPVEEVMGIDISSTLFALGSFVSRFDNRLSYRIQTKYCALCESVCDRGDTLSLRKDTGARHNILDLVMGWVRNPGTDGDPDAIRIQVDLNLCCLRTAVKLLDRLQLRPLDGSTGDDSGHVVSRLFSGYSTVLLQGLDICQIVPPNSEQRKTGASQREADLRELVISGLSHLVSANTESGFKHCLPLAYDDDGRKRTIFAHVFSRVLSQGTKFDTVETSTVMGRRNRLAELVKGSDMVLVMAICETCPPGDVDIMMSVLMTLFDTRSSLMSLLKMMIDREIAHTENEASLFRANSTCTRFLSHFAKVHGYTYVRSLIVPLIKAMTSMPPGCSFELDPSRNGGQDTAANQRNIEMIASSFLQIVSSSIPAMPSMFREICAHIGRVAHTAWPDSKFAAVGAFLFLRFITPAVVSPETVDVELPKDGTEHVLRRGLMLLAKILQNLANNLFFGKEPHMASLNEFMAEKVIVMTCYLTEVNKYSVATMNDDPDEWLGTTSDDTDIIVLHRYFQKHADKIGKELLSFTKASGEDDDDDSSAAASGKNAWDILCATLVDLGDPLEVPRLSSATSSDHRDYLDLMSRYVNRNTAAVQDLFVEVPLPQHLDALFILRLSKVDVEALDIELLMFHIFQTLSTAVSADRTFDVIVDCTSFASMSEIPVQWLKYCFELIPSDFRDPFGTAIILNPNALTHKYLKRVYNISAGTSLYRETKVASSVKDLLDMELSASCLDFLNHATGLEKEPSEMFREVTMRVPQHLRLPVTLEVGTTHLRITSVKAQSVSPSMACRTTEIISLTDISDVYNVSTGHDPHEFIIRRSRPGSTTYFTSPSRDSIVKSIRAAKGKIRDTRMTVGVRFSRYSNVPATLLHVGMLGIDENDEELRNAAYDLLGAVCCYINYDKNPVVASKAGFIPGDPTAFAVHLSDRLADFIPSMTLDFISEVSEGMGKSLSQRINCLQYLSPWVKNLAHFPNPTSPHYEPSGSRLRDCIRTLADMTLRQIEIAPTVQKCVWSEVGKLDSTVVNIVMDELIRSAIDGGIGSERCEVIARIIAGLSSINVRGRIYSKLRKTLAKTSSKVSKTLPENLQWGEIAVLIRMALFAGNHSKQLNHHQLYVPEILHVVSYTAARGQTLAIYLSRSEDAGGPDLLNLINQCTQPETIRLFGLARTTSTSEYTNFDPSNDKLRIDMQQGLVDLLVRIMELTSGSKGLLNVWRARWMSLVTSTAFQHSPAIQNSAFIVLGTLATSDVDDDFIYQILVAFRTTLSQATEADTTSVVSILRCISNMVPALSEESRFPCLMVWLGIAMLQSSHTSFFVEAAQLVKVSLEALHARGAFKEDTLSSILLDGRVPIQDIACQLDQILGLSFESSFSFSLASVLFKGLRHAPLRASGEAVLRTLLRVTTEANQLEDGGIESMHSLHTDALGYFLALLPFSTTLDSYRKLLDDSNLDACWLSPDGPDAIDQERIPRLSLDLLGINDATTALLVSSFLGAILTSAQGNDAESEMLYMLLADVATVFPEVVAMTYESLQDRIKDTFANSSNASIIKSVSTIFRVALQDSSRSGILRGSASTLGTVEESSSHGPGKNHLNALEDLGMHGLASNFQFLPPNKGHATKMINWIPQLVMRIIDT